MTVIQFQRPLLKRCTRCKEDKPETLDYFNKQHAGRRGFNAFCRDCHKARMRVENAVRYRDNREAMMIRAYRKNDMSAGRSTNITVEWMKENITGKPCFYCETVDAPRGCDRLDNDLGHIKTNVVPCCKLCNKTRNNHFSPEEMKLIGAVISTIRQSRRKP